MGKLIAEIVEREFKPLAHDAGVGDSFGNIAEESGHFLRRAQRTRAEFAASSRPALSSVV